MIQARRSGGVEEFYADLALEPQVPVPLYYQLQQQIRTKIELGRLQPGERLPPERAIADELDIARATVRQALDRLCRDGMLLKRRGAGTFVQPRKLVSDLAVPRSLSAEAFAQGRHSEILVLSAGLTQASRSLRDILEVGAEPDAVIRVRRLRYLDGETASLETSWLPTDRCAGLLKVDLTGSLTHALAFACGMRLTRGASELTATVLDAYEAEVLEVELGAAAFLFEGTNWDERDRPVEFVRTLLRGDRFRFQGGGPLDASTPNAYPLAPAWINPRNQPARGART